MKKYVYSEEKAINGIWFCLGIFEMYEQIPEYLKNEIIFNSDSSLDDLYYWDKESKSVKIKDNYKLYQEGKYKLKDGEKIENNTIIKIEQPTKYHKWNKDKWELNLSEVEKIFEEKFKNQRQKKIDADFEYKGSIFQMRENEDLKNFEQKLMLLLLKRIKLTDIESWRLKDNTYKDFTIAELLECADLWGARKKTIWKDFKRVCEELEKANSIEEVENIKWEV